VWACAQFSGSPGIEIQRLFVRTISTQGRNNDAARRWLAYYGPLQSDSRTPYRLPLIGVDRSNTRANECSRRPSGHALQLPQRVERSERDQFEAHQVRLAERELLEHLARGGLVRHVQDKRDSASSLK
jgi:hypothetical protein